MFSLLKNHPFAVEAFFESSVVLTFAVGKSELQHLVPPCLELDTHDDRWAFIAVAMVQTKNLRPKGFPAMLGNDFFLVGYRIFVKYINNAGKRLRGLYILKSETNKRKMQFLGNIFTHYKYATTDIGQAMQNGRWEISSVLSDFKVVIENSIPGNIALPPGSPFADWKEARRFAGPLPFTFSYNQQKKSVLIIEGVREDWEPKPMRVIEHNFSFLDNMNLKDIRLANAFIIENIPYYWKKGRIERWKPS